MSTIAQLFSQDGPLAAAQPNYRARAEQIAMAQQVEHTLQNGGQCVLEAGTGTGKTFAYLAPIMQSGLTALVSTGARALQDQLSQRDIPLLARALGRNISLAVLKGRANYVCKKALDEGGSHLIPAARAEWQAIRDFSARSDDGDIRGIDAVPHGSPLLREAVSTTESCNTQQCPHYDSCFLYKARARARQADIVIVNHHLFLSDMRLKDEGVADLLPSRDVVLFDEAHLLPQLAPQFFSETVSDTQILRFLAYLERALADAEGDFSPVLAAGRDLRAATAPLVELAPHAFIDGRATARQALRHADWHAAVLRVRAAAAVLSDTLMTRLTAHDKIGKLAEQSLTLQRVLSAWLEEDAPDNAKQPDAPAAALPAAPAAPEEPLAEGETQSTDLEDPLVRWGECTSDLGGSERHLTLHVTPMTGRALFARQWEQLQTVLFTSATLSVGGDFRDFCESVGLAAAATHSWHSPYDFANRSLLYLPKNLPQPNDPAHTAAVTRAALPLILANGGRAFVLFSSWRALNAACVLLRPALDDNDIQLLKQRDLPNDELLRVFRAAPRAVLAGSQSFWQGVDVRGEALTLLVVDKIPFTPPTDPLLRAKDEWRKKNRENAFMRNQLPPAVLLMKQVAGRLIRDDADYGVFLMGDPRLTSKGYGKTILKALPPMPQSANEQTAIAFLKSRRNPAAQ